MKGEISITFWFVWALLRDEGALYFYKNKNNIKLVLFAVIAIFLGGLIGGPVGRFLQSLGHISGCLGCGWILVQVFVLVLCAGIIFVLLLFLF